MINNGNKIDKFDNSKKRMKHHDDWVEDITSQNKRRKKARNHQIHQKETLYEYDEK